MMPSTIGLIFEVIALAMIFVLMVIKQATQLILYIMIAAVIVYFVAYYHIRLEKPQTQAG